MSDKKPRNYIKLKHHVDIQAKDFIMVGNSVKSDILPLVEIEGGAFYIQFYTTWAGEVVSMAVMHIKFKELLSIKELATHL